LQTTLTREGLQAVSRGGSEAAKVESRLAAEFSAKEQQLILDLLERCTIALAAKKPPVGAKKGKQN